MKRTSFGVLVLEGVVGLHRTIQVQLLQHYWSEHRLGLLWYWMVALETNRDHSVVFEIAFKYCILDSFVDYNGYSISLKGFFPTVEDVMVIWRREWQTSSVFLPWESHEQYEKNTGVIAISFSRDLPNEGIEPTSPTLAGRFFATELPGMLVTGYKRALYPWYTVVSTQHSCSSSFVTPSALTFPSDLISTKASFKVVFAQHSSLSSQLKAGIYRGTVQEQCPTWSNL